MNRVITSCHLSLSFYRSSYFVVRSVSLFPYYRRVASERVVDETDVLIVGGGPSGLAAAIRLKQLIRDKGASKDLRVVVIDKGGDVGSHILSGAVIEPRALDELFPDWLSKGAPLSVPVTKDSMLYLTKNKSIRLPYPLSNHGNYIASLSDLTKWLASQAESLGVELYSGIAGQQVLYSDDDDDGGGGGCSVQGVMTNDVGLDRQGNAKTNFEPGMVMKAKLTLFAEGCHGSLTKSLIKKFALRPSHQFQTYGLGLKEIWEIDPALHEQGKVMHTIGWPLETDTYGGSFMYHADKGLVYLGFVVGLDYPNPWLSPYQEFQRWKTHPAIRKVLQGGKCIAYGARALNEGGLQSIPRLYFPGGALIGCTAGFLNVPKIKGSHTAMKSGMLAAESAFDAFFDDGASSKSASPIVLEDYESRLKSSWIWSELSQVRNVRPSFGRFGFYGGVLYSGLELVLLKGRVPWTLAHHSPDHAATRPAQAMKRISYPKPDGVLTFNLLENLSRSGTNHEENQPCHLTLKDASVPTSVNLKVYEGPESRYCPAGVYEFVDVEGKNASEQKRLQINAQNCLHCKTCDIKDPTQNINWVPPEGGGGPQYVGT